MENLVKILQRLDSMGYVDGKGNKYEYGGLVGVHHQFIMEGGMPRLSIKNENLFNSNDPNVRIDIDISLSDSGDNPLDDILDIAKASTMYQKMIFDYEGFIGQPSFINKSLPPLLRPPFIEDLYHQRDTTILALICGISPLLDELYHYLCEINVELSGNNNNYPNLPTAKRISYVMDKCELAIQQFRDQLQDTLDNLEYIRNVISNMEGYQEVFGIILDMSILVKIQESKNFMDVISDKLERKSDMYSELEDLQAEYESLDSKLSDIID